MKKKPIIDKINNLLGDYGPGQEMNLLGFSILEQLGEVVRSSRLEYLNLLKQRIKFSMDQELVTPDQPEGILAECRECPQPDRKTWSNRIFYGDNLQVMRALLAGDENAGLPYLRNKIDLIYIDPPFNSVKKYAMTGNLAEESFKYTAYNDIWEKDTIGYLHMLYVRLALMRELLSATGSIMVHLDWHVSHYVKLILDDIFGADHFRNEIVWCYGGGGSPKKHYPRKHDVIFWYSKGDQWTFHKQYRDYTPGTLQRGLTAVKGPQYRLHTEGAGLDDWWADKKVQKILSPTAYENLKYSTQKPVALLQRIILGHSNEGDLVADFFAGTGTCGAAAEQLGRRWILADNGKPANLIMRKRFSAQCRNPFWIQSIREAIEPEKQSAMNMTSIQGEIENAPAGLIFRTLERMSLSEGQEKLIIELSQYYDAYADLKLAPEIRHRLEEAQKGDPLSLIDFWSIDPDYNGKFFKSLWFSFKGKAKNNRQINRTVFKSRAELIVPPKEGVREIAVKIVDIFGEERICQCSL